MYTQTGYDASAHTAEETQGAAIGAAQGVWRSVFYSAMIGWFVLLAFLFAANDVERDQRRRPAYSTFIFTSALDSVGGEAGDPDRHRRSALLRRGGADQRLAHLVRVLARPRRFRAGRSSGGSTGDRVPVQRGDRGLGVLADHRDPGAVRQERRPVRVLRADRDLHGRASTSPTSSRSTCGCGRATSFEPGPWNLGSRYRVVNVLAIFFVIVVVFALNLPYTPAGLPWNDDFDVEPRQLHAAGDPAAR